MGREARLRGQEQGSAGGEWGGRHGSPGEKPWGPGDREESRELLETWNPGPVRGAGRGKGSRAPCWAESTAGPPCTQGLGSRGAAQKPLVMEMWEDGQKAGVGGGAACDTAVRSSPGTPASRVGGADSGPAYSALVQLPTNAHPHPGPRRSSVLLASDWPSPSCSGHLRSELKPFLALLLEASQHLMVAAVAHSAPHVSPPRLSLQGGLPSSGVRVEQTAEALNNSLEVRTRSQAFLTILEIKGQINT